MPLFSGMQGGLQGVAVQRGNALNSALTALRPHAGHSGCCRHGNWTREKSNHYVLRAADRKTMCSGQMQIKCDSYLSGASWISSAIIMYSGPKIYLGT